MRAIVLTFSALVALSACGGGDPLPETATYGPEPQLVQPHVQSFPQLGVPEAIGWPSGAAPRAPDGFTVTRFAEGLDHPRWLHVLPNGDVLVAESSTEASQGGGIEGWIKNMIQRRGGSLNVSANRISLLRDADGDGIAEIRETFAENLNQPFGIALAGAYLYIGNTDAVVRFPYQIGQTHVEGAGEQVLALPYNAGEAGNGHWTRTLALNPLGNKIYVGVGSVTNVADNGMGIEEGRAAIHEINLDGSGHRIFASGLRNPNGMDFNPANGEMWVAVNERDMLGADLVPDYMTSVEDGGFYGWPWVYWGDHMDPRFKPEEIPNEPVNHALTPDYALGAHTASLGLTFYDGASFPDHYQGGIFVGQHGSWNRSQPSGYKVLFVPFENGAPSGAPEIFLTGFLNEHGDAQGRPVGVTLDGYGALLVADDAGDIIWRVTHTDSALP